MLEAIQVFVETVWPRLFVCLFLGFGTSFIPWMFEIKWWNKLLLSLAIFSGWLITGIVLEVVIALKKRSAERKAAQVQTASHPTPK